MASYNVSGSPYIELSDFQVQSKVHSKVQSKVHSNVHSKVESKVHSKQAI